MKPRKEKDRCTENSYSAGEYFREDFAVFVFFLFSGRFIFIFKIFSQQMGKEEQEEEEEEEEEELEKRSKSNVSKNLVKLFVKRTRASKLEEKEEILTNWAYLYTDAQN